MSTPIDLYTYPENATPLELARYQVAVMEAAERGEPAEFTSDVYKWNEWSPMRARHEVWAWDACRYRIARPKIAEGHNPDKLTEAQVGMQDGWRLLAVEEIGYLSSIDFDARKLHEDIEKFECDGWWAGCYGNSTGLTYRTKNPSGHYLPKPAAEPVAETREVTRRDRIATIVKLIRNGSETADQIAARIEETINQPQK